MLRDLQYGNVFNNFHNIHGKTLNIYRGQNYESQLTSVSTMTPSQSNNKAYWASLLADILIKSLFIAKEFEDFFTINEVHKLK